MKMKKKKPFVVSIESSFLAPFSDEKSNGEMLHKEYVVATSVLAFIVVGAFQVATAATYNSGSTCVNTNSQKIGQVAVSGTTSNPVDGSGAATWSNVVGCNSSGNLQDAVSIFGTFAQGTAEGSAAFGFYSLAGKWASAFGLSSTATAIGSTALGFGARALGTSAVAIGGAGGDGTTALTAANSTTAQGVGSVAIGSNSVRGAQTNAADAIAIGGQSSALATSGIALGRGATVNGAFGVAQGDGVTSGATGRNVAIGSTGTTANSTTANGGAVAIGRGQFATGDGAVAIGDPNTANGTGTVAMGANNTAAGNTAGTSAANGAVALGNGNSAIGQGSVALGNTSTAQAAGGIALGDTARSLGGNGTAIGSGATANNASDVALGAGSTTAAPSTGTTALYGATASGIAKAASGTASVGTAGNERQIQNVAAGTISGTSTDAVNGSQLNSVSTGVNALGNSTATTLGAGATYSSTTGAISGFSQPVNTVSTTGALGATTQQTTVGGALTALNTSVGNNANIAVKYDAVGGNTVTLGATGGAGAPAGGVRVTNVTPATLSATSTDAVNGSQLFTTNQNVAGNTTAINSINNGAGIKYFHTNSTLADSTATGTNSVVVGP
ncbi:hypothetical protein ALP97_05211, partial [Pseudomonas salomonii]